MRHVILYIMAICAMAGEAAAGGSTEPGTSNWNFGLAIDDFDGLEFSAEPR